MTNATTSVVRRASALAAAALLVSAAGGANAGVIVYQQDFENPSTIGWQLGGSNVAQTDALGKFSKRNGNNEVTLTVNTIQSEMYTVVFDLYLFDSWDGGSAQWGQDRFNVKVDGAIAFSELLDNSAGSPYQTFRDADEIGQFAFGNRDVDRDSIYRGIVLEFVAGGPTTKISFYGSGLQDKSDESWAIDNVVIQSVPVPATTAVLGAGVLLATRRRRVRPATT